MAATEYRRTPLPEQAKPPVGWLVLCHAGLMFGPFVGFWIHGKVAIPGLVIGLVFAVIPLFGLIFMALRHWYAWRRLPRSIAEEWKSGKKVPAEGAPAVDPPVRFSKGKYWIEIQAEGLLCSRSCLLALPRVSEAVAKLWVADHAGQLFIPWADIAEWSVEIDSDGPDYYVLRLRTEGLIRVCRFSPDRASESDLLDAVRSVGKVPLRLCCDVDGE